MKRPPPGENLPCCPAARNAVATYIEVSHNRLDLLPPAHHDHTRLVRCGRHLDDVPARTPSVPRQLRSTPDGSVDVRPPSARGEPHPGVDEPVRQAGADRGARSEDPGAVGQ